MHKWILKIYINISSINQAKTYCKNNWAELNPKSLNIGACLKYYFTHKNVRFQKMYAHIFKISAHIKIFASNQNVCAHLKISAHIRMFASNQNIFAPHLKYLRIYKMYVPHLKYSRLIIYDSNKAAVEIFAPYEKCMCPENRRPNSLLFGLGRISKI